MTDKELIEIVSGFREGILDGAPSDGFCFMVCAPLQGYLACFGIDTELVESDLETMNHVWLRLPDGRALDPTADQFRHLSLPSVYLGKRLSIHQDGKERG